MQNNNKEEKKQQDLKTNEVVKGELLFDDKVVQKIIGIALSEIDGLLTIDGGFFSNIADKLINRDNLTSGIGVEVGKKQVAVDIAVVVEYGKDVTKIFDLIKKIIVHQVKKITGLDVVEVNVTVVDIKTKEQYEEDSVTLQEKLTETAMATGDFAVKQAEKAKDKLNKQESEKNNSNRVE